MTKSDDLISRDAAIDALSHMCSEDENGITVSRANANSMLRALPSAQPDRKKGEWIWNENGMDWGLGAWCCSECGSKPETWWESDKRNNPLRCAGGRFCGNCGADMRGKEHEL